MKRALIATLLGIAVTATTYGQGSVQFQNYTTFGSSGAGQLFLDGGTSVPMPNGFFNISLYYQLGTVADPMATGTLIATTVSGSGGVAAGYYNAGAVVIPNYPTAGGSITFEVAVVGTGAYALYSGHSSALTLSSIATGATPAGLLDIPAFNIIAVPEPSTFALAGLGAAAMLIFRRRN